MEFNDLKILKMIVKDNTSNLNEISTKIGTSIFEIKKSLKSIQNHYSDVLEYKIINNIVKIKVKNYNSLLSLINDKDNIQDYNCSERRRNRIFKELLKSNEFIKINDLAEFLFVSRGTINNDINSLRKSISKYNLTIKGIPNKGLKIYGNNLAIRIIFVMRYFDVTNSYFNEDINQAILQIKKNYNLTFKNEEILRKSILYTLTQAQTKNNLILNKDIPFNFPENEEFSQIMRTIAKNNDIKLTDGDLYFSGFILHTLDTENSNVFKLNESIVRKVFDLIIETIQGLIIININFEMLYEDLKEHLFSLLVRMYFYVEIQDILSLEIKDKFPLAFELATITSGVIDDYIQRKMSIAEISYLALYFQKSISEDYSKNIEIGVISDARSLGRELIEQEILSVFGERANITYIDGENNLKRYQNEFSIIFSTVNFSEYASVPVINISDVFNQKNLKKKIHMYELKKTAVDGFSKYFGVKLNENESYIGNIQNLSNILHDLGFVDSEFPARLVQREKERKSVFSDGIAIPHTYSKSELIVVCYCYLAKSIEVNGQNINTIFMLAIPEKLNRKQEKILTNIYKNIFSLNTEEIGNNGQIIDFIKMMKYVEVIDSIINLGG